MSQLRVEETALAGVSAGCQVLLAYIICHAIETQYVKHLLHALFRIPYYCNVSRCIYILLQFIVTIMSVMANPSQAAYMCAHLYLEI